MKSKLKIETRIRPLKSYLEEFERGSFQIPNFQRDFLWSQDDIKDLFESLKNNYPIGSILFWKPAEQYAKTWSELSNIGPYNIKKINNPSSSYILDGYQRLSSLFGCLLNPSKYNRDSLNLDETLWNKKFNLFYDLEEEDFKYLRSPNNKQVFQVPVYVFMNSIDFRQYARQNFENAELTEEKIELYYDRADELGQIFNNYDIASVDINNADISEAVEIFRRINEKGMQISKDWIVSALTNKENFRLGSEIDSTLNELKIYDFHTLKRDVIFQCIQSSFGKIYFDYKIEDLVTRNDFEDVTRKTLKNVVKAVKFLYEDLLVLNSKLLPYNAQLIFLTIFFNEQNENAISDVQKLALKKWFWVTSYSNYFTIYSLSNQRKAFEKFLDFLRNPDSDLIYTDNESIPFRSLEFPTKITMGSVRAKSLNIFMINRFFGVSGVGLENIPSDQIERYQLGVLFSVPQKENNSENNIVIVERKILDEGVFKLVSPSNYTKPKDFAHLLAQSTVNLFINERMADLYDAGGNRNEILEIRKQLIINAEKEFVESLGLEYQIN